MSENTTRKTVKIINCRGLHARAAAKFVQMAETHGGDITVTRGAHTVPGNSIMGLLMLGAARDAEITLQGSAAAVAALAALVEGRFGEEE